MKRIEARDQVALGAGRGLQLALNSMSYRMFRSGITISILALAVAFLVHMVCHGILAQGTEQHAQEQLALDRELGERITRLVSVDAEAVIYDQLAAGGDERMLEMRNFAQVEPAEFEAARVTSRALHRVASILLDLPVSAQAVLLADLSPSELFARLDEPAAINAFSDNVARLKVNVRELEPERLKRLFLEERPRMMLVIGRIAHGHQAAIEQVQRAYPGRTAEDLAMTPPADFETTLRAAGFSLNPETLVALQTFARREASLRHIGGLLLNSEVRAAVARETRVAPGDVSFDVLLEHVHEPSDANWLVKAMRSADPKLKLNAAHLLELLERARHRLRLLDVAGDERAVTEVGVFGLNERNQWLIALSFLVCVVGVANAMLMSVTERFTEIATMKCLGAMDRFVMVMFVFEAIVQGIVGGVIGVVLGIALALLRGFAEFGGLLLDGFGGGGELLLGVLLSFVVGVLLAAVAAVGPSWIAARLPPMEAMRVD